MFQKIGGFILNTVLVLACLGSILISAYFSILAFQSKMWTPTEAIIEKVEIQSTKRSGKKSDYYVNETIVLYKYFIGQKEYKGEDICLASFVERKDYDAIYSKISTARKIRVFVNPENYDQSVVVNGFSFNIFLLLYAALFINLLGSMFLFEKKLIPRPLLATGFGIVIICAIYIFFIPNNENFKKYNLADDIIILEHK